MAQATVIDAKTGLVDSSTPLRSAQNDTPRWYVAGENVPAPHPGPLPKVEGALTVEHVPTIDEVLAQFAVWLRFEVADGQGSTLTLKAYLDDTRQHLMWLAEIGLRPAQVTYEVVLEYRRWLVEQYAVSTAGRKLTSVRRFYDIAHARGALQQNPAARVKSPADRTSEDEKIKYISRLQMQKMLVLSDEQYKHSVNKKVKAMRDQAMLLLAMRHGLREIELVRLNEENVKLADDGGELRVYGKRSKWRTIHLVPQTQLALEKWFAARKMMHVVADDGGSTLGMPGTPVFISLHWADNGHGMGGTRMGTRGVRSVIDGYLIAVGAKADGVSGHALRHSFGTWSVYDGADLRALQHEMGHGDINTTTKYSRVTDAMKANPAKYMTFLEGTLAPDEVASLMDKKPTKRAKK